MSLQSRLAGLSRSSRFLLLFPAALITACAPGAPDLFDRAEPGESSLNGSFEEMASGFPTRWLPGGGSSGGSWVVDEDAARSGRVALRLNGEGTDGSLSVPLVSAAVDVEPGVAIDFQVWFRALGDPERPPSIEVQAWHGKEGDSPIDPRLWRRLGRAWTPRSELESDDWMLLQGYSTIVPRGISRIRFRISASTRENENVRFVIDDFAYRVASLAQYVEANRDRARLPDILLVGIDTLRQTALPAYGASGIQTPHIDELASLGKIFHQVTSQSDWTKPSFASVMTSLYPAQHGAELLGSSLRQDFRTLAELLRARGYFTTAFVFSLPDGFLGADKGHAQGFDVYCQRTNEDRLADELDGFLEANLSNLREMSGGGILLFYHIMAPHTPYRIPQPGSLENEGLLGTVEINDPDHITPLKRSADKEGRLVFGEHFNEKDVEYIRGLYSLDVEHADVLLGRLERLLKAAGLFEKMNIVLFSDHGETFGENGLHYLPNGNWGHGHAYQTNLQTPLMLRLPGWLEPGSIDETTLVSNLDIMPTVLDVAGVPLPKDLEGRSLLRSDPEAPTSRFGISEDRHRGYLAIRDQRFKLLVRNAATPDRRGFTLDPAQAEYELYDLLADPTEQRDIAHQEPEVYRRLKRELMRHCRRVGILGSRAEPAAEGQISPETQEALRALGYVD